MKFDKLTVKKLEEAFSIGADVSAACFYADITRQTYYNWVKENKKLGEKFDRLREKPVLEAYQTIATNLHEVDTAKWFLERKRKTEFSTRVEQDHTGIQNQFEIIMTTVDGKDKVGKNKKAKKSV